MGKAYDLAKKVYRKLPAPLRELRYKIIRNRSGYSRSYSQCGEDMVVKFLLGAMPQTKGFLWLDIGAHDPIFISNTAAFYRNGLKGINIEANPKLIKKFYLKRKKDINLNVAIADKLGTMAFYIMDSPTLSTLSEEEAHELETMGHKIKEKISIKTMTVTEVIEKYNCGVFPDFLSLDAEGYDLQILKTIEWEKSFPKIICVENIPYKRKLKNYFKSMQQNELTLYLESKGYSIIAFTLINAIFVHNNYVEKA
jgi:FkbM family methyltransferase